MPHGHVVVVVAGQPLAHGKYPFAYWGRLGGGGAKDKTVNWAWARRLIAGEAVDICRHDKIVLVQPLDLLGAQRHRRITPAERDIGVVHLGLGEGGSLFDEGKSFAEILETIGSLDPRGIIDQRPI